MKVRHIKRTANTHPAPKKWRPKPREGVMVVEVKPNAGCSSQGQRIPVSLPAEPKWGKLDG